MKHNLKLTTLLLFLLGWSFVTDAQDNPPLKLMPDLEPITAANATRLQPIAELGVDLINSVAWSPDGKLIAFPFGAIHLWGVPKDSS